MPRPEREGPAPSRRRIPAGLRLRVALTAGWLAAGAALLRFWDLTIRVEAFLLWCTVFVGLYAASVLVLDARGLVGDRRAWAPVPLWVGVILAAWVVALVFPRIPLGDRSVQTVALVRVLDMIVPLWILLRGVHLAGSGWQGTAAVAATPAFLLGVLWILAVRMPGESYRGPSESLTAEEVGVAERLKTHVSVLAGEIGPRGSASPAAVRRTVAYIRSELQGLGYAARESTYEVDGRTHRNLEAAIPGAPSSPEIVVVGAHYDTYPGAPGADDNASGVASVLELARLLAGFEPRRTIRFVFFGTEEPPHFNTEEMGSRVYARRASEAGEEIVAAFSLDPVGYFDDEPGSQRYPPPLRLFYPDRGDFVAFVGNPASAALLRRSLATFRRTTRFPSEGIVSPSLVPGVELSDHASFWRHGYPGVLISDTGPFRNPNYHTPDDDLSRVALRRTARVVVGLGEVLRDAAGERPGPGT